MNKGVSSRILGRATIAAVVICTTPAGSAPSFASPGITSSRWPA